MKQFYRIIQRDAKTYEFLGEYENMSIAAKMTKTSTGSINKCIEGKLPRVNGYVFERYKVKKEVFDNAPMLSIQEYMYYHDLEYTDLARLIGISEPTLRRVVKTCDCKSYETFERISEFGVVFESVISEEYRYEHEKIKETFVREEAAEIVCKSLSKSDIGEIVCAYYYEARAVAAALNNRDVVNYIHKKSNDAFYVKYDATITEENDD